MGHYYKEATSGKNVHLYRGISIAFLFGKLGDKFRCARFSRICEEKGLRSFTQCGFWEEHGTLDAIYTFLHAADSVKSKGKGHALIACLVYFEKAFDKAHRGLMLKRLGEFGVSGQFYDAMVALYDKIQMVVCLNGEQGTPFDTYQGTKQGSELSPILFGLFIEQLHHLLKEKVPGAGPEIGKVKVPDIFYADDFNLIVVNNAKQMQEVLDVLQLFCKLFGMKVNEKKTKVIIIRNYGKAVPEHLKEVLLTYGGQSLSLSEEEKYLGVVMHESKDMCIAGNQRGAIGAKACFSMMVTVAQKGIQRPDIACNLFDTQVRRVLSYVAHIWGPYMFTRWAKNPLNPGNKPEKVHTAFLRQISGMGKSVHKASLYKEFGRDPLMVQWLVLAARLWNKMTQRDENALMRMAFSDNLVLALRGKRCWAWHFLQAMSTIGIIKATAWQVQGRKTAANVQETTVRVLQLFFDEEKVEHMARIFFDKPWADCQALNPATAPSGQVFLSTYKNWVGVKSEGAGHLSQFIPMHLRRQLVGLRCGCHPLNVHRMRFQRVPREARTCKVCDQEGAVD